MNRQMILYCEQNYTPSTSTGFLLELAGYQVVYVKGLEEAINWLSLYGDQQPQPAMVLVTGRWSEVRKSNFLEGLCRQEGDRPLLLLDVKGGLAMLLSLQEKRLVEKNIPLAPVQSLVKAILSQRLEQDT